MTKQGLWILVLGREYFLPHREYPWFKKKPMKDILNVRLIHSTHLHWPTLDIDLELGSLSLPDKYPLIFQPSRSGLLHHAASEKIKKYRSARNKVGN